MLGQVQMDFPSVHRFSNTGLYDFRINDEINVILGCGLGGTSLINAGVALKPAKSVFSAGWPAALTNPAALGEAFRDAEYMLEPARYPETFPVLPKLAAFERTHEALEGSFSRPPINITFKPSWPWRNPFGVHQRPCNLCGDCMTGCNYGAKSTLIMNYLPRRQATRRGDVHRASQVRSVERECGNAVGRAFQIVRLRAREVRRPADVRHRRPA